MHVKGTALRKIRDFFECLVNIRPSHETIREWINEIGQIYWNFFKIPLVHVIEVDSGKIQEE